MQTKHVYLLSTDRHLIEYWEKINNNDWEIITLSSVQQLSALTSDQLVIIDIDALNTESTDFWQQIFSKQSCIVTSLQVNDTEGRHVLVLGAKAYVHGYSNIGLWRQILTHVQNGHIWLGESLLSRLLSDIGHKVPMREQWKQGLTLREIDVAQRIALGHSNKLIASDLGITERTVRAHLGSAFTKLGVNDRLMLALRAHGLA